MKLMLRTIDEFENLNTNDLLEKFSYQSYLTGKLDEYEGPFDQSVFNEILLWKVNRYARVDPDTEVLINQINPKSTEIDIDQTKAALNALLNTKGIRLPVASTILRFRNPNIFQIIDKRVYRYLYGKNFKIPYNHEKQIELYIEYNDFLKMQCAKHDISFRNSDRILYQADKEEGVRLTV